MFLDYELQFQLFAHFSCPMMYHGIPTFFHVFVPGQLTRPGEASIHHRTSPRRRMQV